MSTSTPVVSTIEVLVGIGAGIGAFRSTSVMRSGSLTSGAKIAAEPAPSVSPRLLVELLLAEVSSEPKDELTGILEALDQATAPPTERQADETTPSRRRATEHGTVLTAVTNAERLHYPPETFANVVATFSRLSDAAFGTNPFLQASEASLRVNDSFLMAASGSSLALGTALASLEKTTTLLLHNLAAETHSFELARDTLAESSLVHTLSAAFATELRIQEVLDRGIIAQQYRFEQLYSGVLRPDLEISRLVDRLHPPMDALAFATGFAETQRLLSVYREPSGLLGAIQGLTSQLQLPGLGISVASQAFEARAQTARQPLPLSFANAFDADRLTQLKSKDFLVVVSVQSRSIIHIATTRTGGVRSKDTVRDTLNRLVDEYPEPEYDVVVCYGTSDMVATDLSSYLGWDDADVEIIESSDA